MASLSHKFVVARVWDKSCSLLFTVYLYIICRRHYEGITFLSYSKTQSNSQVEDLSQ